jgi:hypothetical protein
MAGIASFLPGRMGDLRRHCRLADCLFDQRSGTHRVIWLPGEVKQSAQDEI